MIIFEEPFSEYIKSGHYGIHSLLDFEGEYAYTPARFYERHVLRDDTDTDSKAKAFGRACHKYVLEGEHEFLSEFIVRPKGLDLRMRSNPEVAAYKKKKGDKPEVTFEEYGMIRRMFEQVRLHSKAAPLLRHGFAEVVMRIQHQTGLPVQSRVDWLGYESEAAKKLVKNARYLVDLKTIDCLDSFRRDMRWRRYHRQAAFYQWIAYEQLGSRLPFYFVAVEKISGHRVGVFEVSPQATVRAHDQNMLLCQEVWKCFESKSWGSGSPDEIEVVEEADLYGKESEDGIR